MYSYFSLWGLLLFFCLDAKEKVTKEKIKAALFGLLRSGVTLKKKNSLRSNSFFFLTLRKAPPLHAQKVRPISDATSLRSLEWMFSNTLLISSLPNMSSRAKRRISNTSIQLRSWTDSSLHAVPFRITQQKGKQHTTDHPFQRAKHILKPIKRKKHPPQTAKRI